MSFKNQADIYLEDNISKYPAIDVLSSLGYTYISPEDCLKQRHGKYNVILKDILKEQLIKLNSFKYGGKIHKFSEENIEKAINKLNIPLIEGLSKTSERIYNALMLGKSYPEVLDDGKILSFDLKYIDWDNFENNVFTVTEEYAVNSQDSQHNARPDIVLFINGIPFAVIECKAPTIECNQAISQMIRNQRNEYIPQLYKFVQIVMATNVSEVKYATATTGEKYWNVWHEQDNEMMEYFLMKCVVGRKPTVQDRNIISLFNIKRVKELIQFFVFYDANVKKICRYQQYFAIKEIIKTINQDDSKGNRQGGVIWHTQGSGKSLTMVMLAHFILTTMSELHPRVIIVTDRTELDKQIAKTFANTHLKPARATSGKNLVDIIKNNSADVVTTVINKFNTAENNGTIVDGKDIFVLVDESHRSNYGPLAAKMRIVFPEACYIGFTGTPLMKTEKNTMLRFGKLIHKYTIEDGVNDKAIVPLIYEGRMVEQNVDQNNIDMWFDHATRNLSDTQKIQLKNKWSSMQRISSNDERIKRIAFDINVHFLTGFKNSGFKAMLACNFKKDAVRYQNYFEELGELKTAVVISPPDIREGFSDVDESNDDEVINFWKKMMNKYGDAGTYEDNIKCKFVDGEIDIVIVCSKWLTGFDAPRTQVLYIDKELKEHGLLQAIARTNRLYDGKDFGLIVDYRGLITKLDEAMNMYGSGLENFDPEDIKGTIVDVLSVVGELREKYSQLISIFSQVTNMNDPEEIASSLLEDEKRTNFYYLLCEFGKKLKIVLDSEKAYESFDKEEIGKYKDTFAFFSKVRRDVKIRYCDLIDNKEYETQMQNLLDRYLSVKDLKQITNPIDILNKEDFAKELKELVSDRAKADAIRSHLAKSISKKHDENPAYYDSFSKRILDTLKEFQDRVISESEYYEKLKSIMQDYQNGVSNVSYPEQIKGNLHAQAFYGVVYAILDDQYTNSITPEIIAEISIKISDIIEKHNAVDWKENIEIHKRIAQDIDDMFYEFEKNGTLTLSFDTIDKIIENVKTVALRRF